MSALTIGLEELIESVVFKCPCEGHFAYGLAFLWAPAFLLFLAGILIDRDLWKITRIKNKNKSKPPARRYLKAFLATPYIFINAGIAPAAWLVLSFLQQHYYTCAYFGPPLDSDVIVSNTTDKCHVILGLRSRELEESYKARSQITGWSLMVMAVCILLTSVCIRRFIQREKELKMPSLEYYRHKEAEEALKQFHAAAKELAKKSAKENVEKLFQTADPTKASDARIEAVSDEVNSKYGMFFVIPSPESPGFTAQEVVARPPGPPQFPQCVCETDGPDKTDGPQIPTSNGGKKPCRSVVEETNLTTSNCRNPKQAVSRVGLHRHKPVIDSAV